jgi:predicted  nucleic acid-binding Zn-ribbon protein
MNELKEKVYSELGILQLRERLNTLREEIVNIDTEILKLAQNKSYLQSDLCNLNREIARVQSLLEPKNDE